MRCPKCKKQLREGAKFCPACGARVKKRKGCRVVAVLLAIILLLGVIAGGAAIGIFAAKRFGSSKAAPKISNVEEAIAHAKKLGEEFGYENAMSEMTEKVTTEVDGDCYYRLQQNYKGIPVYGRTAVYVADEGGNVASITGNVLDVNGNIDLTPTVTYAQVASSVQSYCARELSVENVKDIEVEEFQNSDLCIYISDEGKPCLAYCVNAGRNDFILDAHNAEILFYDCLLMSDTVTGNLKGQNVLYKDIDYFHEGGEYYLKDPAKKIEVYNIINSPESRFNYDYNILNYFKKINIWNGNEEILTWFKNDSPSTAAVDAYVNTQIAYKYFEKVLNNISVDGTGRAEISILVGVEYVKDDKDGKIKNWTENAFSGTEIDKDGTPQTQLLFNAENEKYTSYSAFLDVVAHEYMHAVEKLHSGMVGGGECGAIKEGLSDIFGEMVESWYREEDPNWIHSGSSERNLRDPGSSKQPAAMNDKHWKNPNELRSDNGYAHHNSTVISHAAYLMWNGINNDASKKIDTEKLAKLWYRAMLMMPSDCNFVECRTLVELAASSMKLTDSQKQCVSEAFDAVGIVNTENTVVDYELAPNCKLQVIGKDDKPYDNYKVTVSYYSMVGSYAKDQPLFVYHPQYNIEPTNVTTTKPFSLPSEEGIYKISISDNLDPSKKIVFSIRINSEYAKNSLAVYTNFEKPLVVNITDSTDSDAYNSYRDAVRVTTASGKWTESMNLTANMAITDGSTKTKTKMTMTSNADISNYSESDPSKVRMSGAVEMSVMGQTYAWNMRYEDGIAHYQYTQPNQTSADMAIDPSFFNFGTMTSDMMTNAQISDNQITFTIPRDKITEVGIAAVNQMSGVDDLKYGDVNVTVTISNEGTIDTIMMVFHASLKYQGYDADVDYDIAYHFSQNATISNAPSVSIVPCSYTNQENKYDILTVHEVNGNQIVFSAWWYRIWDIYHATATLDGNIASFDYTDTNNPNTRAKGTIEFADGKAILTISECSVSDVHEESYRFNFLAEALTEQQLRELSRFLGVPDDLDVTIKQGTPYYWEGVGKYCTEVGIYYNGELIAGADVDSLTGGAVGGFYIYSGHTSATSAYSSGTCGNNLSWSLSSDGTLTISGSGDMYGYPLGDGSAPWLNSQVPVTSVVFNGGITSIGEYAFCNTSIKNISIPASVTVIEYAALDYIDTLEGIWVDGGNPVYSSDGSGVLFNKGKTTLITAPTKLKGTYTVPTTVSWIYDAAFSDCSGITTINLPDSVSRISQGAFSGCSGLEYICIPSSMKTIEPYTFYACSSMTGIRIPEGITSIGWAAFGECPLKDVFYGGTNQQWQQMMENCSDDTISSANVCELSY